MFSARLKNKKPFLLMLLIMITYFKEGICSQGPETTTTTNMDILATFFGMSGCSMSQLAVALEANENHCLDNADALNACLGTTTPISTMVPTTMYAKTTYEPTTTSTKSSTTRSPTSATPSTTRSDNMTQSSTTTEKITGTSTISPTDTPDTSETPDTSDTSDTTESSTQTTTFEFIPSLNTTSSSSTVTSTHSTPPSSSLETSSTSSESTTSLSTSTNSESESDSTQEPSNSTDLSTTTEITSSPTETTATIISTENVEKDPSSNETSLTTDSSTSFQPSSTTRDSTTSSSPTSTISSSFLSSSTSSSPSTVSDSDSTLTSTTSSSTSSTTTITSTESSTLPPSPVTTSISSSSTSLPTTTSGSSTSSASTSPTTSSEHSTSTPATNEVSSVSSTISSSSSSNPSTSSSSSDPTSSTKSSTTTETSPTSSSTTTTTEGLTTTDTYNNTTTSSTPTSSTSSSTSYTSTSTVSTSTSSELTSTPTVQTSTTPSTSEEILSSTSQIPSLVSSTTTMPSSTTSQPSTSEEVSTSTTTSLNLSSSPSPFDPSTTTTTLPSTTSSSTTLKSSTTTSEGSTSEIQSSQSSTTSKAQTSTVIFTTSVKPTHWENVDSNIQNTEAISTSSTSSSASSASSSSSFKSSSSSSSFYPSSSPYSLSSSSSSMSPSSPSPSSTSTTTSHKVIGVGNNVDNSKQKTTTVRSPGLENLNNEVNNPIPTSESSSTPSSATSSTRTSTIPPTSPSSSISSDPASTSAIGDSTVAFYPSITQTTPPKTPGLLFEDGSVNNDVPSSPNIIGEDNEVKNNNLNTTSISSTGKTTVGTSKVGTSTFGTTTTTKLEPNFVDYDNNVDNSKSTAKTSTTTSTTTQTSTKTSVTQGLMSTTTGMNISASSTTVPPSTTTVPFSEFAGAADSFTISPESAEYNTTSYSSPSVSPSTSSASSSINPSLDSASSSSLSSSSPSGSSTSSSSSVSSSSASASSLLPSSDSSSSSFVSSSTSSSVSTNNTSTDTSTSISSTVPIPTTTNPECSIQCPEGYIVGSNECFSIVSSTKVKSYQSALSYCRLVANQDLISYEHLRDRNNLHLVSEYSIANEQTWYFANGGGSLMERFNKQIAIFNIFDMTMVSSPTAKIIGISDTTNNVSAICVKPQFCNKPTCLLQTSLEVLGIDYKMKAAQETIQSQQTTTVTCSYTKQDTTMNCGTRGNLVPHPSLITCEPESTSQILTDNTGDLVSSCSECYGRGTSKCEAVTQNETTGYVCKCSSPYSMKTCWYTPNKCNINSCGNGTCTETEEGTSCSCLWGYEGKTCEISKNRVVQNGNDSKSFIQRVFNTFNSSALVAVQITFWTVLLMAVKMLGKIQLPNDEDDPQETHQTLRGVMLTMATTCVLFFSDPYLFLLSTATCRIYFLLIHFLFAYTLTQWMFEGFNANQVLRCRHVNRWDSGFDGKPAFGIQAFPRFITSIIIILGILVIIYNAGWYQLVSSWTCIGVVCEKTSSMWMPIGFTMVCILLFATAIFESSILIIKRRPLLDTIIRNRIDKQEGVVLGQNIEKCRRNPIYCLFGVWLLAATWGLTILTSDKKENKLIGLTAISVAGIYGAFSFIQGVVTCPPNYAGAIRFLMRKLPERFAPNYEPMRMWSREEIIEVAKIKDKKEKKLIMEEHIPKNARHFLQYKWDYQLGKKIIEGVATEQAINEVLREQMEKVDTMSGTEYQRVQVLEAFAGWLRYSNVINPDPEIAAITAKNEIVSICASGPDGITRVSNFFITPRFGAFEKLEPIVTEGEDPDEVEEVRRKNLDILKKNYAIMRREVQAQANFIRSAIHFKHFGKITE